MRAYQTYHAEAVPRERNDSPRLLTDKGRKDARRLGFFLKNTRIGKARVLHNGTTWIQENAEILARVLENGNADILFTPSYPFMRGWISNP